MSENSWLKRTLTLFPCVMIMITSVIGSGIFTVPGEIMAAAQGSGTIFLAWVLAGICVFFAVCKPGRHEPSADTGAGWRQDCFPGCGSTARQADGPE